MRLAKGVDDKAVRLVSDLRQVACVVDEPERVFQNSVRVAYSPAAMTELLVSN
jgi:hypothetical protein